MPDDQATKKAIYNRSVSAVTSSHTTLSNAATAGSTSHLHTIASQDSFEEQLREDEEGGSDAEEGEIDGEDATTCFSRLPGGKSSLYLEGQIEKKSPAHNLWQERWFKLMTRVSNEGDSCSVSVLMTSHPLQRWSTPSRGPRREAPSLSRPSPQTLSLASPSSHLLGPSSTTPMTSPSISPTQRQLCKGSL
jgi:hypothetical protein